MEWLRFFILLAIQLWIPVASKIMYVLPDNSTNDSCPFQPCATLSEYLLDNGTLPVVSNVQYYFLPGEHHVPANMLLQDLCNFSIIGTVKESPPPVMLVGCLQSYVINVINSYNFTIANVMFRRCDQIQLDKYKCLANLLIDSCYSCTIENVVFLNSGLKGTNLIGKSYLTKILIKSYVNLLVFCQGITLYYWDKPAYKDHKHVLIMDQINISHKNAGNKYYYTDSIGIHIIISVMEDLLIVISNSSFYGLDHTAVSIGNQCHGNNTIIFEECIFERNTHRYTIKNYRVTIRPLIDIVLSHVNKTISFKQCSFKMNYNNHYLIAVLVRPNWACYGRLKDCIGRKTDIVLVKCRFTKNLSELINVKGTTCRANLFIIGPTHLVNTARQTHINDHILFTSYMTVHLIGPVIISSNHAKSIMHFESSNFLFDKSILIASNNCYQVIALQFTFIKVMEYTNITLLKNKHLNKLIETEYNNEYRLYPLCIFQFVTLRNATISPTHYSINIIDNLYTVDYPLTNIEQKKKCSFPLYYFTTHCQWLPNATFHNYSPKILNQQIIKIHGQNLTYHRICHCSQNGSYNCNVDTLGPVYPGQMLQIELCTPCNDGPSVLYAEVNSVQLPSSACRVASYTEINVIYNYYSKPANFTIVSEANNKCELFLATSSSSHYITEAFYVQLLSCPVGFTLQNGVCNCDPIFSTYTTECYIDDSAIKRSANTWITAYTQINSTKYLISDCPMDYCLPYSSKLNLLYPDLQCQFNRSGILCSQCQYHLSMVFGSSRCMECTNLSIILISVTVIIAGVVLVVLLYILNLTVTNGTISGIIFYANIVSINDSVFLVNENVFNFLKVFISFLNLDLGVEMCFFDRMDTYAKMWLQLFFPFYLLVIAISIIMVSRYSSRVLRLTYTRSLPVLATLFLLSYTGVLRVVLTVLFSYSTVTHLPSGHQQIVWSIDASVPLFGIRFTILFITCLVLFLFLIPFNIILLFTRYLLQYRVINYYKPLLDAFKGSYKDNYYYWVGLQLLMRSFFFAMYAFQTRIKLILSTILLMSFSIYTGCIYPHKSKIVNIQELLLLINLSIMYALSYQGSESIFYAVINTMVILALLQLLVIILCHFLAYTCHCDVGIVFQTSKLWYNKHYKNNSGFNIGLLTIPERTYNYAEYQDGLVSDDFK